MPKPPEYARDDVNIGARRHKEKQLVNRTYHTLPVMEKDCKLLVRKKRLDIITDNRAVTGITSNVAFLLSS
jgi:hypothetical protein